jgi:hypothetical protein
MIYKISPKFIVRLTMQFLNFLKHCNGTNCILDLKIHETSAFTEKRQIYDNLFIYSSSRGVSRNECNVMQYAICRFFNPFL